MTTDTVRHAECPSLAISHAQTLRVYPIYALIYSNLVLDFLTKFQVNM